MGKKEKKTRKKGKRVRKGRKHEGVKIWKKYEIKGDSLERKNPHCPRCGAGTLLSRNKNSLYCGKCGYTDFKGAKQPEQPKHAAPQEAQKNPAPKEDSPEEKK